MAGKIGLRLSAGIIQDQRRRTGLLPGLTGRGSASWAVSLTSFAFAGDFLDQYSLASHVAQYFGLPFAITYNHGFVEWLY
jgi:hypothetical protein